MVNGGYEGAQLQLLATSQPAEPQLVSNPKLVSYCSGRPNSARLPSGGYLENECTASGTQAIGGEERKALGRQAGGNRS